VDATHTFVAAADIAYFHARIADEYLPGVDLTVAEIDGVVVGFAGMSGRDLAMLFVDAAHRGQGVGIALLKDAMVRAPDLVLDVNEQNPQAIGFYLHHGFRIVGRTPVDSTGKPYPLLHLAQQESSLGRTHMGMTYGSVRGVDKPVSRLVQGTVPLTEDDLPGSLALLDAVYEHGCRTFDTAHGYGNGACERVLGQWIRHRGVRDDVVILGKGAHPYGGRDRVTPEDITSDLHESLARQGTDFIDIYVLHRDNPALPVGPIVEVLNEHQRAGRIGVFGGSNWAASRVAEANAYAHEHGLEGFTVSSPNYSLAVQVKPPWEGCLSVSGPAGADDRQWYIDHGIPIFPWSSLAGGFFSGRFRRDNLDTFEHPLDKLCVTSYCSEENFRRLDRVEELGKRVGLSIPQVAMAYIMSQPLEVFALVGCRTGDEFRVNTEALGHTLADAERAWLDLSSDERPW
jgi:aryl-alcohol dehydrogenase-like predicted oxidoreductase